MEKTNKKEWQISNIGDLDKISDYVLEIAQQKSLKNGQATVVALHGDLGAGKTTFTKQLAKDLGITETVTSPTFVIQKSFSVPAEFLEKTNPFKKLIHIDTYRIDLQDELIKLGWSENISLAENIIAVEWPENIPDIFPENTIHLYFKYVDEVTRSVEIK
jgi:tRNA threonylcarbamoyladenosine biosynthesis protein TsaE